MGPICSTVWDMAKHGEAPGIFLVCLAAWAAIGLFVIGYQIAEDLRRKI